MSLQVIYRVFRGAECPANTDHYDLVATEVALFACQNSVKPSRVRIRYSTAHKRQTSSTGILSCSAQNRSSSLSSLPDDLEECWTLVRSAIHSSAKEVIGYRRDKSQAWLSDASYDILQEKCTAKLRGDDT